MHKLKIPSILRHKCPKVSSNDRGVNYILEHFSAALAASKGQYQSTLNWNLLLLCWKIAPQCFYNLYCWFDLLHAWVKTWGDCYWASWIIWQHVCILDESGNVQGPTQRTISLTLQRWLQLQWTSWRGKKGFKDAWSTCSTLLKINHLIWVTIFEIYSILKPHYMNG